MSKRKFNPEFWFKLVLILGIIFNSIISFDKDIIDNMGTFFLLIMGIGITLDEGLLKFVLLTSSLFSGIYVCLVLPAPSHNFNFFDGLHVFFYSTVFLLYINILRRYEAEQVKYKAISSLGWLSWFLQAWAVSIWLLHHTLTEDPFLWVINPLLMLFTFPCAVFASLAFFQYAKYWPFFMADSSNRN